MIDTTQTKQNKTITCSYYLGYFSADVTPICHYSDVIMSAMVSQITSLTIVYSTVYSGADQRKPQSSVSLAFVRGIHRSPVNSPHKEPVTRKMFPFDDVTMATKIKFTNVSYGSLFLGVKTIPVNVSSFEWIAIKYRHPEAKFEAKMYRYIHKSIKHFMKYI